MKTKLLKKLRKTCSWKCIQQDVGGAMIDEWMLLQRGCITRHPDSEQVLLEMLRREAMYGQYIITPWHRLYDTCWNKSVQRRFDRIDKINKELA
jgi:hypothetical protein